jgi:hypothetical protein
MATFNRSSGRRRCAALRLAGGALLLGALAGCAADRPAPPAPVAAEPAAEPACPREGAPLSCAGTEEAARRP